MDSLKSEKSDIEQNAHLKQECQTREYMWGALLKFYVKNLPWVAIRPLNKMIL